MKKLKEVFSSNTLIEAILKYIENQYGLKINELNTDKVLSLIYEYHISDLGFDEKVLNIIDNQISEFLFNNESYFFRNKIQLPVILEYCKKNQNSTIVSFGCSKGQEAYTISMYLKHHNVSANIIGIDLDKNALEEAIKGIYTSYSLKNLPKEYEKYFDKVNDKFAVKDLIKENVSYKCLNILKEDISNILPSGKADIVLMNNVLIYFNKKMLENTISTFANILKPKGLVFTSEEEFNIEDFKRFFCDELKRGCKFYLKPDLSQITDIEYRELYNFKYDGDDKKLDYDSLKIEANELNIRRAKDNFYNRNFLKTIAICYNLLQIDPINEDALSLISESCYELGYNEEAKKWLKTYLIVSGHNEEKIEKYLNLCLKTEDFFEYIRILKKKITLLSKKDDIIRLRQILKKAGLSAEELSDYMQ